MGTAVRTPTTHAVAGVVGFSLGPVCPDCAREGMKSAHREWHPITADKVPAELRKKWQSIIDRLTVVKDDEQGHVPATIDSLSDDDLNDLAMDIMDFADRVNRFY